MDHRTSKTSFNDVGSFRSENDKITIVSGSLVERTIDNIPVRVTYKMAINNLVSDKNPLSQQNDEQIYPSLQDLKTILEKIILNQYKPCISSQTIIGLPVTINQNQEDFIEQIKVDTSKLGVTIDEITIKVFTTPVQKVKTPREKIFSCLLSLIIFLLSISVLFMLYS